MKEFLKKIFKSLAFDLGLVFLFILGVGAYILFVGPENVAAESYQPLAPIPGFEAGEGDQALGQYINSLYRLSIGLGAVLAVLMIVVGGLQYMTTDNFGTKGAGRKRIEQALMGLGLLLISFIVLNTINPDLLDLDVELQEAVTSATLGNFEISEEELESAAGFFARNDIAEESSVESHLINLNEGYKVADGQKYCPRAQIAPTESDEEKQTKILNLEKRCNANLLVAQRERGDKRDYRGCQTLENPNGGFNIVQSCYYFKDKE